MAESTFSHHQSRKEPKGIWPRVKYQFFSKNTAKEESAALQQKYFKLFPYLNEDLKAAILSFVADAPFELMPQNYPKSNLTHNLPAVNRQFHSMCSKDIYWKDAVLRMVEKEPHLWRSALCAIAESPTLDEDPQDDSCKEMKSQAISRELVESTQNYLRLHDPSKSSYKSIYECVVNKHLRFTGPVFFMPGQVALGESYALHLFETRYRILISTLMQNQSSEARNGGSISKSNPLFFLHANRAPLEPTVPAVLVRVLQCFIYPDGRADVVLLPVSYVWLERIWVCRDQGQLYYAQSLKMGRTVTQQMNHLQRQEALAHVMDRLAGELADESMNTSESE